ncbi:hypothetical protein BASA50_004626 [Batrachochytrium salamandrivorans]|uniref:Inhibitor I9 domain-containing protein n=1 Tax=Batrachochytrium salamandrivorans TaxID=1357716 RepID=A0ABQ8FF69_9FUNG|nr:hypothetical protein BASA62_008744 [Batrachochytrium salamandrivorans]KAH6578920.1 hypothetical protein BASA61_010594 [Batrachochytrium salamandrivorans]KAH6581199.1 hypothetical protein BASA60_002583 [Batrachochytrium salamandrivorans]KAH6597275.1 hypothetical protein BASA50_004626 [Batrachochytrium salamandrivorans]KAH9250265.1 hypothetical protein BASA81_011946 [Batrachochytrium salamandrivorans]
MFSIKHLCSLLPLLLSALLVLTPTTTLAMLVVPNEANMSGTYLLSLMDGLPDSDMEKVVQFVTQAGGSVIKSFSSLPIIQVQLPVEALYALSALNLVNIELDQPMHTLIKQ